MSLLWEQKRCMKIFYLHFQYCVLSVFLSVLTHTVVAVRQPVTIATGTVVTSHRITALVITFPIFFTAFIYICQSEKEMMNRRWRVSHRNTGRIQFECHGPAEWVGLRRLSDTVTQCGGAKCLTFSSWLKVQKVISDVGFKAYLKRVDDWHKTTGFSSAPFSLLYSSTCHSTLVGEWVMVDMCAADTLFSLCLGQSFFPFFLMADSELWKWFEGLWICHVLSNFLNP